MTITCLIGNGFDLGLGLKTRYLDFLPWYLSRKSSKSDAVKWLCGQIENSKDDTWADAEMAFGRLPFSEAGEDVAEVVDKTLIDFQKDLALYIGLQQNRLVVPADQRTDVRDKFVGSVVKTLYLDSKASANSDLRFVLQRQIPIEVNFISFNYTASLDKLLGGRASRGNFQVPISAREKAFVSVSPICYVHGNLRDQNSLFGVDDACQITDPRARVHCETSGMLLKPKLDYLMDYGFEQQAKEMILKSNRIVCLGLSYGASDVRWWECIYKALSLNEGLRLLLSPYFKENQSCASSAEQSLIARRVRNAFLGSVAEKMDADVFDLPGVNSVRPRMVVMKHSPHIDFDGNVGHCDPFNLKWFGRKYVKDYGK